MPLIAAATPVNPVYEPGSERLLQKSSTQDTNKAKRCCVTVETGRAGVDRDIFEHSDGALRRRMDNGWAINWSASVRQTRGCANAQEKPPALNGAVNPELHTE